MRTTKRYFRLALLALCLAALFASVTALAADSYQWPVPDSKKVTQAYKSGSHTGIDIGGTNGSKIVATKSGTVTYVYTGCVNKNAAGSGNKDCAAAGCSPNCKTYDKNGKQICNWGYGNGVIIKHSDGSGYSMYAHMNSVSVRKGDTVSQGDKLGTLGSSGYSTGPHLHFELTKTVQQSGTYFKPTSSINSNTSSITYVDGPTSSSGGGGGGSSSSSSKPSASVSGSGGKVEVADDGTVTITPDEGYRIDSITINGEEIQIPTDGKLTDLDKDDEVVVTFAKDTISVVGPFADVSVDAWYADAVQYVYEKGMMNGTGENSFSPDETTTRGMIVTMLYRLENEPAASASAFTDVAAGSWYADAVAWAAAQGIVNGISDTAFAPETAITREQMTAILYRCAQLKGYDVSVGENTNILSYTDAASISEYAIPAMQWACGAGLITGDTATTPNPLGNATRAEVATMLMRFIEHIA